MTGLGQHGGEDSGLQKQTQRTGSRETTEQVKDRDDDEGRAGATREGPSFGTY